jgi:hypothetical protein
LEYNKECFKEEIEGMKKQISEKDLVLEEYGGIDNGVEALLLTLRSGDVEVGPEGEDIFGWGTDYSTKNGGTYKYFECCRRNTVI